MTKLPIKVGLERPTRTDTGQGTDAEVVRTDQGPQGHVIAESEAALRAAAADTVARARPDDTEHRDRGPNAEGAQLAEGKLMNLLLIEFNRARHEVGPTTTIGVPFPQLFLPLVNRSRSHLSTKDELTEGIVLPDNKLMRFKFHVLHIQSAADAADLRFLSFQTVSGWANLGVKTRAALVHSVISNPIPLLPSQNLAKSRIASKQRTLTARLQL